MRGWATDLAAPACWIRGSCPFRCPSQQLHVAWAWLSMVLLGRWGRSSCSAEVAVPEER